MDQYVAIGHQNGLGIVGGQNNIAIGHNALGAIMAGQANVAIGYHGYQAIVGGQNNIAIGHHALDDMPFMAARRRTCWYSLRALCPLTDDVDEFRKNLVGISKAYLRKNMFVLARLLLMNNACRYKCIHLLVNLCGRSQGVDKVFDLVFDEYIGTFLGYKLWKKYAAVIQRILLCLLPNIINYRYILEKMTTGILDEYTSNKYLLDATINNILGIIVSRCDTVVVNHNYENICIMLRHRPDLIGNVLIEYLNCTNGNAIDLVYKFINADSVKNIVASELNKHIVKCENSPRAFKLVRALATYGYDMKSLGDEFGKSAPLSSSSTRILTQMFSD